MTKLRNCPDCAVMKAFREAVIQQKGWRAAPEIEFCKKCKGSGKVLDDRDKHKRYGKRKKDMSGDEWDAEERAREWDHYITFERPLKGDT